MNVRPSLAFALCACACATRPPEVTYYRLQLPEVAAPAESGPIIAVEPFVASAIYDEERIAYRTSPYKLEYYHYHRWASPPGLLVSELLRLAYGGTGRFGAVLADVTPETTVSLRGRILEFEEVDVTTTDWVGNATIELVLHDVETGAVLWHRIAERTVPLEERSPEGLAQALSDAVVAIAEETTPEIARAARAVVARRRIEAEGRAERRGP